MVSVAEGAAASGTAKPRRKQRPDQATTNLRHLTSPTGHAGNPYRPPNIPERRQALQHPHQIGAIGHRREHLPQRHIGQVHKSLPLHLGTKPLLLHRINRPQPSIAQRLDARAGRPTRCGGLAVAAQPDIGNRVHLFPAAPASMEDAPSALIHRLRPRPALHRRRPVHGLHIHVEPDVFQQLPRHIGHRRIDREIARRHHHGSLALIAGFRQRLARRRHIARRRSARPCRHRSPSACPA